MFDKEIEKDELPRTAIKTATKAGKIRLTASFLAPILFRLNLRARKAKICLLFCDINLLIFILRVILSLNTTQIH